MELSLENVTRSFWESMDHLNITDPFNITGAHNLTDALSNTTTTAAPTGGNRPAPSLPWDNPDNIMTQETSDDITFSLQCFVFPILTVFGLTGNVLSMVVMLQKKLRGSTTTIVLVGLALSDILFLITNMYRKSVCIIGEHDPALADEVNAKSFRYAFYLKTAFSRVSTLLVVVISLERLIAVAFPLSVKTVVTKGRMVGTVVACFFIPLAGLAGLPPQYTYATVGGRTYIAQTDFALENVEPLKQYNEYFLPITFRYIPVLLVLILNVVIVVLVRRSSQFQKKLTSGSKRDNDQRKITRMLLTVSLIYLICLLPGDILLICSDQIEGFGFFGKYHNAFLALSDLSLLFEIVNSSVNFIIYMVLNRRFSEVYMQLFCSCLKGFTLKRATSSKASSSTSKRTKETGASLSAVVDKVIEKSGQGSGIEVSSGYVGSTEGENEKKGYENEVFQADEP